MRKVLLKVSGVILIIWGLSWIIPLCFMHAEKRLLHTETRVVHDVMLGIPLLGERMPVILRRSLRVTEEIMLFLGGPILIFAGIRLFSFKRLARKLAIFSYLIVLAYTVFLNISWYMCSTAIDNSDESPFSIVSIIEYFRYWPPRYLIELLILMLIPTFFIVILFRYKEQFK